MTRTPKPLDPQAQKLPPHPYAALFPRLEPGELREMAADIARRGLLEPICVLQGTVLDGLNRQDACFLAKVAPVYQEFVGDDPLGFVCAKNFRRRQLTQAQKALVAARLVELERQAEVARRAEAASQAVAPTDPPAAKPVTIKTAARGLEVSERSAFYAQRIVRSGDPELERLVERDEVSLQEAEAVARQPAERRRAIVARGAKAVREAARQAARDAKEAKAEVIAAFGYNPMSVQGRNHQQRAEQLVGEVGRILRDLDALTAKLTHFVRSEAGANFCLRLRVLELPWVDYSRVRVEADGDGGLRQRGERFVGLREVRRLIVASSVDCTYPAKRMLELLTEPGENELDSATGGP